MLSPAKRRGSLQQAAPRLFRPPPIIISQTVVLQVSQNLDERAGLPLVHIPKAPATLNGVASSDVKRTRPALRAAVIICRDDKLSVRSTHCTPCRRRLRLLHGFYAKQFDPFDRWRSDKEIGRAFHEGFCNGSIQMFLASALVGE
jgi:hypothetical protein